MRLSMLAVFTVGVALSAPGSARAEPPLEDPAGAANARAPVLPRVIALVPFGVGQFQNGNVAGGVAFAGSEAVLVGVSTGTFFYARHLLTTAPLASRVADANANLATVTPVNRVSFAGLLAVAAAGAIEAEVNLGPTRARVTASPTPRGATVGLNATF